MWPADTGGRIRSLHLLSELSHRHQVTLLTTHAPGDDPRALAARLPRCTVASLPWAIPKRGSAAFAAALARSWLTPAPVDLLKFRRRALRQEVRLRLEAGAADLCVADFLSATANVPSRSPVPVVLFAHNVEHLIWKRLRDVETRAWRRALLELEWRKLRRAEARACAAATLTVAVSEPDAELLRAAAPGATVRTIPTGVDAAYFAPGGSLEIPAALVFTGSMDWHPNEDAVLHFLHAVLPRIRKEVPDVSFTVVGRNPGARLRAAADEAGVLVTGTVEDIRPHVATAAVYVVPLRIGGGTRLKIFEALAMGKAVVSTGVGAEGLPLAPGSHFLQADAPEEFARAVVGLLRDPVRRRSLGEAGRRLVETRFSWPTVAEILETRLGEALDRRRSGAGNPRPAAGGFLPAVRRALPGPILRQIRAQRSLGARGLVIFWMMQILRALGIRRDAPTGDPAAVRSVLYVCRGNIIRSPMAAALLKACLGSPGGDGVSVSSAGLQVRRGQRADPRALRAARSFGVSLEEHRARPLTAGMVARASRIVPMDSLIEAEIRQRHAGARQKIVRLDTGSGEVRARPVEIPDPYDGDEADVHRCYELLLSCVRRQAASLAPGRTEDASAAPSAGATTPSGPPSSARSVAPTQTSEH
jgi:protein-tyrosine-phosphatase/glycosyltransferase involved in cell wall biosynthesis